MKFIRDEYYEVAGTDNSWKLAEKFSTLGDAVKGGKEMNEQETSNGYKPSAWIVTRTSWDKCIEDDGTFISQTSTTIKMHID